MKSGMAALVIVLLLAVAFFAPADGIQKVADQGEEEGEENAGAPWFNEGDPWFEEGDELNRLSNDEIRALAEQNETVRKMLEEDQKLEPVRIESLEDLEHLPENYPEEMKRLEIEDYLVRQNLSEQTTNNFGNVLEPKSEGNESTKSEGNESIKSEGNESTKSEGNESIKNDTSNAN
ncbi:hypothetical protein [Methanosarcina sp. DH1]|uniref:hypothetical protein n=1 Tax=Methanosarcina sp. DH1 TaxID=2605695 RepID=UPI001E4FC6C4